MAAPADPPTTPALTEEQGKVLIKTLQDLLKETKKSNDIDDKPKGGRRRSFDIEGTGLRDQIKGIAATLSREFNQSFMSKFLTIVAQMKSGATEVRSAFMSFKKMQNEFFDAQMKVATLRERLENSEGMSDKDYAKLNAELVDAESNLASLSKRLPVFSEALDEARKNLKELSITDVHNRFDDIEDASSTIPGTIQDLKAQFEAGAINTKEDQEGLKKAIEYSNKNKKAIETLEKRIKLTTDERLKAELKAKLQTLKISEINQQLSESMDVASKEFVKSIFNFTKRFKDVEQGSKSTSETLVSTIKFVGKVASSGMSVARAVLSGDAFSAVQAGFDAVVDIMNDATKKVSSIVSAFGGAIAASRLGPVATVVGAGISMLGIAMGAASDEAARLAKEGFAILTDQARKLVESYMQVSNAGAIFEHGMSDLVSMAGTLGLPIADLSAAIKENKEKLTILGGTVAAGTKKFVEVGKAMGDSGLRGQLMALGVSIEDQNSLTISFLATQAMSLNRQNLDSAELSKRTGEYIKNLKLISALTGEDVKALDKKGDAAVAELYMYQELTTVGGEAVEKYKSMAALMDSFGIKAESLAQVYAGGFPQDQAIMYARSATLQKVVNGLLNSVKDNKIGLDDFTGQLRNSLIQNAPLIAEELRQGTNGIALADLFSRQMNSAQKDLSTLLIAMEKLKKGESIDGVATSMKSLLEKTDPTTQALTGVVVHMKKLQIELESKVIPTMKDFSKIMGTITAGYDKAINEALARAKAGNPPPPPPRAGPPPPASAPPEEKKKWADKVDAINEEVWRQLYESPKIPGLAEGGVASGPLSGFLASLHGTEAVVPLPDGRSIPIKTDPNSEPNMNISDIKRLLETHGDLLRQQVAKLEEQNDRLREIASINSDILNNAYS